MSDETRRKAADHCRANDASMTVRIEINAPYYQLAHAAFAEVTRRPMSKVTGRYWADAAALIDEGWSPASPIEGKS